MTEELLKVAVTALLSAGGAWAAVHAELRALWRAQAANEKRIERLENNAMRRAEV